MLIRPAPDLRDRDVTDKALYLRRRQFIAGAAGVGLAGALGVGGAEAALSARKSTLSTTEKLTPKKDITTYNNFYVFGVG
jgi:sulfoxide reductase catalytic subunit YedY